MDRRVEAVLASLQGSPRYAGDSEAMFSEVAVVVTSDHGHEDQDPSRSGLWPVVLARAGIHFRGAEGVSEEEVSEEGTIEEPYDTGGNLYLTTLALELDPAPTAGRSLEGISLRVTDGDRGGDGELLPLPKGVEAEVTVTVGAQVLGPLGTQDGTVRLPSSDPVPDAGLHVSARAGGYADLEAELPAGAPEEENGTGREGCGGCAELDARARPRRGLVPGALSTWVLALLFVGLWRRRAAAVRTGYRPS
jgi:hypothetical protein